MKVSIEGFNQEYAITLKKEVIDRNKNKKIKIDCTDLVILRWFVDFYPNMKKILIEGKEFAWLSHKKIMEDLPLIDISKRGFSERLQKLVEFNILTYKLIKENGTFTVYGFGENYNKLVNNKKVYGSCSNDIGGSCSNDIGVIVQTATKDKTINNKTIKKDNKKEKKESEFDVLINQFENNDLKDTLYEFIKMRKTIKKPLTTRALQLIINKLHDLADNDEEKIDILNQSIMNNWLGVFPLKTKDMKGNEEDERLKELERILQNR